MFIGDYEPLAAGSNYKALPAFLKKKHAIVNVRNQDNRCFGYAVLSAIYHGRLANAAQNTHAYRAANYTAEMFQQHQLDGLDYPVTPADVPEIERRVGLSINVFAYYDDEGRARYPVYISRYYIDWNEEERQGSGALFCFLLYYISRVCVSCCIVYFVY